MSAAARRIALALALALVAAVAAPRPGAAGTPAKKEVDHRVTKGDTLELLAAEYYGSRNHAIFIMKANGMTHPRPLRPGEVLKIPVSLNVTARVGDTLSGLAETYLGDRRRASFLAEFNNLPADATIAAGESITIPLRVTHVAAGKVTLRELSLAYFRTPKYRDLLRRYNFLEKETLSKGDKVEIPIVHVRVRDSKLPKLDKESAALAAKRKEMQEQARTALPAAGAAWRAGRYAEVKRLLTDVDPDYLDASRAVAVGVLLGSAYVAFDDTDSARAAFHKALERKPDYKLSTYTYSPKIVEVWKAAGGEVRRGR